MSQYKYETFAQNVYDNFADNNLDKNWEHFEKLWSDETGNGIIKDNSYISLMNINNTTEEKKKKCLVIKATGDSYTLDEPKGLKGKSSKRVGGGVKSKHLMGPGEYNIRVKFTPFDGVCNALWLFNYFEIDSEDVRHPKNKHLCVDNNVESEAILNPEIDFELLDNKKCRCNVFRSTNDALLETTVDLNEHKLNLQDSKWHNLKYIWETGIVKVSDLIGRELTDGEIVIYKENSYINDIKEKRFYELNGMSVYKSIDNDNEYCIYYGKNVEILIDGKKLFKKELKDITIKNLLSNPIPNSLSYFYIALWYPNFIKTKPEFYHTLMVVDTFEYKYNGNPFHRLNKE
tara:strand:- start:456 stop:1490 length:1035 start_codon:yes stop_codon:yes gene_type:complete